MWVFSIAVSHEKQKYTHKLKIFFVFFLPQKSRLGSCTIKVTWALLMHREWLFLACRSKHTKVCTCAHTHLKTLKNVLFDFLASSTILFKNSSHDCRLAELFLPWFNWENSIRVWICCTEMELSLAGRAQSQTWSSMSERGWERRPRLCWGQVVGGSELAETGISHVLSLWKGNFIAFLQTCSRNCCFFQAFALQSPPCLRSPAGSGGGRNLALSSSWAQSSDLVHKNNLPLLCLSSFEQIPVLSQALPSSLRVSVVFPVVQYYLLESWLCWGLGTGKMFGVLVAGELPLTATLTTGEPLFLVPPSVSLQFHSLFASTAGCFQLWRDILQYCLCYWELWAGLCIFLIIVHWDICLEITDFSPTSLI